MRLVLPFIIGCIVCPQAEAEAPAWLTESRFQKAIDRPLIAIRDLPVELRPFLTRLSEEREVAVLLDCRVDPRRNVRVNLRSDSFPQGIADLAAQAEAQVTILADTVIVAPPRSAARLRTLAWLLKVQLTELAQAPVSREFELARRRRLHWDDLTEPRQLVDRIAASYDLEIEGLELIPYDLWAAGDIAYPNAVEALLILLTQFELSFEWLPAGSGIRLIPAPEEVTLTREYTVSPALQVDVLQQISQRLPAAVATVERNRLTVEGTLEELEAVAQLLRGNFTPKHDPAVVPLVRQRFTLKMVRQPAGSLLKTLQVQDVDVRFDFDRLLEQGVDLRQPVSLEVRQVPLATLLTELARQLPGLAYRIDGETVYIEYQPPAP